MRKYAERSIAKGIAEWKKQEFCSHGNEYLPILASI